MLSPPGDDIQIVEWGKSLSNSKTPFRPVKLRLNTKLYKYYISGHFRVRSIYSAQTQVVIVVVFVTKFEHNAAAIVGRDGLVFVVLGIVMVS